MSDCPDKLKILQQKYNNLLRESTLHNKKNEDALKTLRISCEKLTKSIDIQQRISHYASLTDDIPLQEMRTFILKKAVEIFKVKYALFSDFDQQNRQMIVSEVLLPDSVISKLFSLAGINPVGYKVEYKEDFYYYALNIKTEKIDSLTDLSHGKIPGPLSSTLQKIFGLGWFQPLALVSQSKIFGLITLIGHSGQEDLPHEELLTFSYITANALKRKEADNEVKIKDNSLRAIVNVLPDMLFVINKQGYFKSLFTPQTHRATFDLAESDCTHISCLFSEEDTQAVLSLMDDCLSTGELKIFEYPIQTPQKTLHFEARITSLSQSELLMIVRDITQSKKIRHELNENLAKMHAMMENTHEYIWAWSTSNSRIYSNSKFRDLLKLLFDLDFQEDMDLFENIPPRESVLWKRRIQLVLNKGHRTFEDVYIVNGHQRFFETSVNPIRLDGMAIGVTFISKDITERKHNISLEKELTLARRTAELKRNFLANLSHELRTPLTGILGMTQVLQDMNMESEHQEFLNLLAQSGKNMQTAIDTMIDFADIELDKIELKKESVGIHELVNGAIEKIKIHSKDTIDYSYYISNDLPARIIVDAGRLEQILNNLLNNAEKFTSQGKITINVAKDPAIPKELMQDKDKGPSLLYIRFEVIDSGCGLTSSQQEKLFEPFYGFEVSDLRHIDGTGLGLAICKGLVNIMGGKIGVESLRGKGCTFWFTIEAGMDD
jgi:PAS domain S-box-containing protein